jgi:hypothetical protein
VLLARQILLQVAPRDIGQLTYIEPRRGQRQAVWLILSPVQTLRVILDVSATGPAEARAVGLCGADGGTHDFVGQTPTGFAGHWNDHQWRRVAVPASGEYDVVPAISPRNVWVASVTGDPVPASQNRQPGRDVALARRTPSRT